MRGDSQDVSAEVWQEWILEAIRKIRSQKQRPSTQRICQAIGSHHKFHEDIVAGKLEEAVANGAVIKLYNKGLHSYKAPVARKSVNVSKDTDITRLVVKAVRELGECDGSNVKKIETYVQKSNNIVLTDDTVDFRIVIKNALRTAVAKEFLVQEGNKLYKVGKVSLTSPRKRRSTSPRKKPSTSTNASAGGGGGGGGDCSTAGTSVSSNDKWYGISHFYLYVHFRIDFNVFLILHDLFSLVFSNNHPPPPNILVVNHLFPSQMAIAINNQQVRYNDTKCNVISKTG